MTSQWNDSQPIYWQLKERTIAMILDGTLQEGDCPALGAHGRV